METRLSGQVDRMEEEINERLKMKQAMEYEERKKEG